MADDGPSDSTQKLDAFAPYFPSKPRGYASPGAAHPPEGGSQADIPLLFQPLTIRGVTLKNRVGVSPMCMYSYDNGVANHFALVHLGSFALGGAGLIIMEATGVEPIGRITPRCHGLWSEEHMKPCKEIVNFLHACGSAVAIQLAHAGRKASAGYDDEHGGWEPIGPSALCWGRGHRMPREMTVDDIHDVIDAFVQSAQLAVEAGFDIIEIHGAHGYLISSFLSPTSNERTDDYGGSFENRCRFLLELVERIRAVIPEDMPLFCRLSCHEWVNGGWSSEDTVKLAPLLRDAGVDLIDCSSGGNSENQRVSYSRGYQVPFSAAVKNEVDDMLTGAVGAIFEGAHANAILEAGEADVILSARGHLHDPKLALTWAEELGVDVDWPTQYGRGKGVR